MNDAPPNAVSSREEFLTARQLAAILQVSESTVRRLARANRIPSIRIAPRIVRFHLDAVRTALDPAHRSRAQRNGEASDNDLQLSFADLLWKTNHN